MFLIQKHLLYISINLFFNFFNNLFVIYLCLAAMSAAQVIASNGRTINQSRPRKKVRKTTK